MPAHSATMYITDDIRVMLRSDAGTDRRIVAMPKSGAQVEVLEELEQDNTVPRNVKEKIQTTIQSLKEEKDLKMSVNKALHELDEIADDPNLQAFTRTQIWNIVSLLEQFS